MADGRLDHVPATPPAHCLGNTNCSCRWHIYRQIVLYAPHVLKGAK